MVIRDGVDVGTLGLLGGQPISRHPRHDGLAHAFLGSALGVLSIDADMTDDAILVICQSALSEFHGEQIADERSDETRHRDLAIKVLLAALRGLPHQKTMGTCRVILTQIRELAKKGATVEIHTDDTCVASHAIGKAKQ